MNFPLFVRDNSAPRGFREASHEETVAAARRVLAGRMRKGCSLTSPGIVRDYLMTHLGSREHELFTVIFVDSRHRLIARAELFRGTIDGASVYPREVVKEALRQNAAAVVLAHCHPSGVAEPSHADELITQRLRDALALVDIRVLDHLIVAGAEVMSFAERGLL
jgi:DNA repair protein RadC